MNGAQKDNPAVLIRYNPENAPLVLADNAAKMLGRIQGVKAITNAKQLEAVSEIIDDAKITSEEVEIFVGSLREGIQKACERVREFRGFEDFEATLTVRKWGLRQLLNDGITRLRNDRARFNAAEEDRLKREQLQKQAEQDRINKEAADKAAAAAKKQGADKATIVEIKQAVMETPAPIVTSQAVETARDVGASVRYQYTAKITDLKKFLGLCLANEVFLNTLWGAIPDIEAAFRKMASDQKEAFKYAGITYEKKAVDVGRRA